MNRKDVICSHKFMLPGLDPSMNQLILVFIMCMDGCLLVAKGRLAWHSLHTGKSLQYATSRVHALSQIQTGQWLMSSPKSMRALAMQLAPLSRSLTTISAKRLSFHSLYTSSNCLTKAQTCSRRSKSCPDMTPSCVWSLVDGANRFHMQEKGHNRRRSREFGLLRHT